MTVAIKKQLDESLRDALLALYLNNVAPKTSETANLTTAQDLYEYWLLDVLVSQDVPTTPVACAVASLQQYINRILMNMEPGYDRVNITPEHMQTWRNEMHQYPIWAAHQNLLYFPANYLAPVLRTNKSDNFQQLENDLNQNRIQAEAVQTAVMAYLARFEEVANLNILNGYIDGDDFAKSTYYFIAKSRTENTYFWRSLDMAQRPLAGTSAQRPAIAAKLDQPDPFAWSDWEKADVPIPESAIEHSIRPAWFNNRLFVVWAECIHQDPPASSASSGEAAVQPTTGHPLLRLSFCFKKQDGKWSAPRIGLQGYCNDKMLRDKGHDVIKASIGTVAEQHNKGARGELFITLYAAGSKTGASHEVGNDFTFNKTICIDSNLATNSSAIAEKELIGVVNQRIQTTIPSTMKFVETPPPTDMSILMSDFQSQQKQINISSNYDGSNSTLTLRMSARIDLEGIDANTTPEKIKLKFVTRPDKSPVLQLDLVLSALSLPDTPYVILDTDSQLTIIDHTSVYRNPYRLSIGQMSDVLRDSEHSRGVTLQANTNPQGRVFSTTDLQGKVVSTEAVRHLIKESRRENYSSISGKIRNIKMQASDDTALDFDEAFVNFYEPLNHQYVIFRQPTSLATQAPSYKNLTVVAESAPTPTLREFFEFTWHRKDLSPDGDAFFCGVAFSYPNEPETKRYSALKGIRLNYVPTRLQAPDITAPSTAGPGTAQVIDFTNSTIETSDTGGLLRQSIRLNTTFAAELIRRTENGLDELLDWTTQHLLEPAISKVGNSGMDFHGPYGRYFTELFLYLPWLVAHRLNAEQRYEEAERWLRRVFDPSLDKESRWRAVPLIDSNTPSYADQAPHDPHQIALSHPVHFRKALYFLYLDILINRGDAAYRELTPDGLSEAKLWYVRVQDLLGPRPVVQPIASWATVSLQKLSETTNGDLRTFEQSRGLSQLALPIRKGGVHISMAAIDNPYLRLPFHPQLLRCWDVAESRLHNLRHNLDIAGKPLHLPAFAVPLDPRALLSSSILNTSDHSVLVLPTTSIPHYRFSFMHSKALSAVESLSQFGASLLSLIERKEQAQVQELQQQQAWNLAKISVGLQRQALNIDRQNRKALLASQAIAQNRANHYKKLLDDNLTSKEIAVSGFAISSGSFEAAALVFQVSAGLLMLAPNQAGLCFGGSRWEGPLLAASAASHSAAIINRTVAADLDRQAIFDRRRQDWQHTYDQSLLELAQIDAQLAQFTEQETASRLQLRLAESTLSQTKTNYDFLSKRFTKAQLYQWLNSQLAALYRQAYDTTLSLCLAAEHCWQYEISDYGTRFIQPGAWNTTYRGLGAGDQLKLSLLNMQAGYLSHNKRELEIRKTISLRILKEQTTTPTINKSWSDMHTDLKKTGECVFELSQELFENDYKDQKHYLRRIKTISVSLPTVVGPYENIRATLTQTSSEVYMSAEKPTESTADLRPNQQIALSTGVDDNGLFTLNFNDERYLPFEYTGAVSKWKLTFPNHTKQKEMLQSLTDIIVNISYTAKVNEGAL